MKNIADRFWSKVKQTNTCWLWKGMQTDRGYGQIFTRKGETHISVHRFSWELHNKIPIPEGMLVCHSCDVRSCVNPNHLFLGTAQDNQSDAAIKGRTLKGSKNPNSKLSEKEVKQIKKEIAEGLSDRILSIKYNVTPENIYFIRQNKTWAWLKTN